MLWFIVVCFAPACLTSLVGTWLMRRLAPRFQLIDQPNSRKVHTTPTPLGGGLAIYVGFLIPVIAAQLATALATRGLLPVTWIPEEVSRHLDGVLYRAPTLWGLVLGGTLLVLMGLLDDLHSLPWPPRLAVQLLVAAGLLGAGVRATVFVEQPWVGAGLTIFWIVLLTNSFNFLDNMDGLSGGIGLIASLLFAGVMLLMVSEPRWLVGGALLVLAGSIAGFLWFNWAPASIFMGDSGSMFIGMMLAGLTVLGTFYDESHRSRHVILAPLCVLAVPLYDFTTVMLIRLRQGRSPFHPDKNHFSHRLVDLGLRRRDAVLTVLLATLTTGIGALLLYRLSDWTGACLVLALILCVLMIIAILETVGRRKNGES